jgi:hypothetical protein
LSAARVPAKFFQASADGYHYLFNGTYANGASETYREPGQTLTTARLADLPSE